MEPELVGVGFVPNLESARCSVDRRNLFTTHNKVWRQVLLQIANITYDAQCSRLIATHGVEAVA